VLLVLIISFSQIAIAVPIDWKGSLELDSTLLTDFRRTNDNCDGDKGMCITPEGEDNARFQNMILQLNPNIIVNDGVTIKGELSTGNAGGKTSTARSQTMGSSTTRPGGNLTNAGSYYTQSTSSGLNLNQLYAEIYADTALYRVGRFAKHFGLGAVINAGTESNDMFYSGYEGFEAQLEIQNFHLDLMWAKLSTNDEPNGSNDAYESSVSALYDDAKKELKFGIYYALREVEGDNDLYNGGSQNVTLIDVFFSKSWEDFSFGLEIPMMSGEVGGAYGTDDADFDANAYILETKYQINTKWNVGLNAGMVKGDNGDTDSFEGLYLHPNYQLAQIMYRYNYYGFNNNDYNVFDSSIVNSTYAQLFAHYKKGEWGWKLSALWAKADQTAKEGESYYNHAKRALSDAVATEDQSDDLGYEFDVAFEYQWNPSVMFSGFLGYHVVGDYYAFSDDEDELSTTNVMSTGMRLAVEF
tara:strand:+ start:1415 stop:2821 length:1407 start_codon:yes stop_codon:yes gene_type:complete